MNQRRGFQWTFRNEWPYKKRNHTLPLFCFLGSCLCDWLNSQNSSHHQVVKYLGCQVISLTDVCPLGVDWVPWRGVDEAWVISFCSCQSMAVFSCIASLTYVGPIRHTHKSWQSSNWYLYIFLTRMISFFFFFLVADDIEYSITEWHWVEWGCSLSWEDLRTACDHRIGLGLWSSKCTWGSRTQMEVSGFLLGRLGKAGIN